MSSLEELLKQAAALDKQIADVKNSARAEAIGRIRSIMAEHGLTKEELEYAKPTSKKTTAMTSRRKVAAKFRDDATGATWSGRGLKPRWLSDALSKGRRLEDFTI